MVRRALFVVALLALIAPLIAGCNPEQNLILLAVTDTHHERLDGGRLVAGRFEI
mgnify:CR=1 FL=1